MSLSHISDSLLDTGKQMSTSAPSCHHSGDFEQSRCSQGFSLFFFFLPESCIFLGMQNRMPSRLALAFSLKVADCDEKDDGWMSSTSSEDDKQRAR